MRQYAHTSTPALRRLLGQQISINLLVAVLKKDRLPAIPTLRNVMGKVSNHRTRQSCHGENIRNDEAGQARIMSPYLPGINVPAVTLDGLDDPLKPGGTAQQGELFVNRHEHRALTKVQNEYRKANCKRRSCDRTAPGFWFEILPNSESVIPISGFP